MKKIVGITCDNYKLDTFKKELEAGGFTSYDISQYTPAVTLIRVNTVADKVVDVGKICKKVEFHFKHRN